MKIAAGGVRRRWRALQHCLSGRRNGLRFCVADLTHFYFLERSRAQDTGSWDQRDVLNNYNSGKVNKQFRMP